MIRGGLKRCSVVHGGGQSWENRITECTEIYRSGAGFLENFVHLDTTCSILTGQHDDPVFCVPDSEEREVSEWKVCVGNVLASKLTATMAAARLG